MRKDKELKKSVKVHIKILKKTVRHVWRRTQS